MTIAGWALPKLLGRPRVFRSGVLQVHLGAASLATNTDIGMVHVRILVSRPSGAQHDSRAGSGRSLSGGRLLLHGRVSE